eukprot:8296964-Pyramimonas_sp.AAC.1
MARGSIMARWIMARANIIRARRLGQPARAAAGAACLLEIAPKRKRRRGMRNRRIDDGAAGHMS